jgi:hypothetical protein
MINYAWVNTTDGGHVGDSHEIVCDFTRTFLGSCVVLFQACRKVWFFGQTWELQLLMSHRLNIWLLYY